MFQSREKLTGGIFPNEKKISRLLSAKQPADLRACLKNHFHNLHALEFYFSFRKKLWFRP